MTLDDAREVAPDVAHETVSYEVTPKGKNAVAEDKAKASATAAQWGWPGARASRVERGARAAIGVMRYSPGRWSVSVASPDNHRVDLFRATLVDALMAAADVADGINPEEK